MTAAPARSPFALRYRTDPAFRARKLELQAKYRATRNRQRQRLQYLHRTIWKKRKRPSVRYSRRPPSAPESRKQSGSRNESRPIRPRLNHTGQPKRRFDRGNVARIRRALCCFPDRALGNPPSGREAMKAALYARVSTHDGRQTTTNQLIEQAEFCERRGWPVLATFTDEQSGATADRGALRAMLEAAHRREFDVLVVWALDRFTREGVLNERRPR